MCIFAYISLDRISKKARKQNHMVNILYKSQFSLVLLAIVGFLAGCESEKPSSNSSEAKFKSEIITPIQSLHGPYRVSKVTDGDTIHVIRNGLDVKIRIIGINTPEVYGSVQCYGPKASEFAKANFFNSSVYLEYDKTQSTLDRYGRVLAHVWTSEKKLYAAEAIRFGYGVEATYAGVYHHRALFQANQELARSEGSGLWSKCSTE